MRIITTLSMAALAAAAPAVRQPGSLSQSDGFTLIAKVTDPSRDLDPSVDGMPLSAIHTGAALNAAVLWSSGRVFFQNGTAEEAQLRQTTIITEAAMPGFPFGISVPGPAEPRDIISISVGPGTYNIIAGSDAPAMVNGLGSGTYLACNATVPYYQRKFITLQYAYDPATDIPAECAPIALVPQCATLDDLPEDSHSSHEFVQQVPCYEEVV